MTKPHLIPAGCKKCSKQLIVHKCTYAQERVKNGTNLFRREFEVLSDFLHPLLCDDHCLRTSKTTEGSIGRKISATDSAHSTIVGNIVDIVRVCDCSFHYLNIRDKTLLLTKLLQAYCNRLHIST